VVGRVGLDLESCRVCLVLLPQPPKKTDDPLPISPTPPISSPAPVCRPSNPGFQSISDANSHFQLHHRVCLNCKGTHPHSFLAKRYRRILFVLDRSEIVTFSAHPRQSHEVWVWPTARSLTTLQDRLSWRSGACTSALASCRCSSSPKRTTGRDLIDLP